MANKKDVLIITPSVMVAKGIESILGDMGEFRVAGILSDLDRGNDLRLKNMDIDIVLLDPSVFGYDARGGGKSYFADFTDAPVLALVSAVSDEDILRSYDGCVTLFDAPNVIVRKLRAALETKQGNCRPVQSLDLHGHHPQEKHYAQNRDQDRRRTDGLRPPEQPDRHQFR